MNEINETPKKMDNAQEGIDGLRRALTWLRDLSPTTPGLGRFRVVIAFAVMALEEKVEEVQELKKEILEWEQSFDLYQKADQRGVAMFRQGNPDYPELTIPDKGRLVQWLLEQLANQYRNPVAEPTQEVKQKLNGLVDGLRRRYPDTGTPAYEAVMVAYRLGQGQVSNLLTPTVAAATVAPVAQALTDEAWRMLPDSCKEIMKGSVEQTWKESLAADIEHAFQTKTPQ